MNRFFDFTPSQLKFLAALCGTAVVMGVYLLVRAYAYPPEDYVPFEVIVGENEQVFTGSFIIDPNTSPADSLELLSGIGKVLADRIVVYRDSVRFEHEIDITNVKGIGPRLYERLKPYLRVRRK